MPRIATKQQGNTCRGTGEYGFCTHGGSRANQINSGYNCTGTRAWSTLGLSAVRSRPASVARRGAQPVLQVQGVTQTTKVWRIMIVITDRDSTELFFFFKIDQKRGPHDSWQLKGDFHFDNADTYLRDTTPIYTDCHEIVVLFLSRIVSIPFVSQE